jgi:hypothetical protein
MSAQEAQGPSNGHLDEERDDNEADQYILRTSTDTADGVDKLH